MLDLYNAMTGELFAYFILSYVVRQIMTRVRKRFEKLDGDLILAVSFGFSLILCAVLDVRVISLLSGIEGVPIWADYLGSSLGVTLGASAIQDILSTIGKRDEGAP